MYQPINPENPNTVLNYLAQLRRAICIHAATAYMANPRILRELEHETGVGLEAELLEQAERFDEAAASVGTPLHQVVLP